MYGVSWTRYDGSALADITLQGGALLAELEDYIRLRNPHFTDSAGLRELPLPGRQEHVVLSKPADRSLTAADALPADLRDALLNIRADGVP